MKKSQTLGKLRSEKELLSSTQKKSYDLFKREENKAKKERLSCLLLRQFVSKYGAKQPNSRINHIIKETINSFLAQQENADIAKSLLDSLETQIRDVTVRLKSEINARISSANQEKADAAVRRNSNNTATIPSVAESKKQIDTKHWAVVNAILSVSDEELRLKEQREAFLRKQKFRAELDRQAQEIQQNRFSAADEKSKTLQTMKSIEANLNEETRVARMDHEKHLVQERKIRLDQIEERKSQRERERQETIVDAQADIARAKRLIQEEEELKRLRRDEQKRRNDEMIIENERNKALKEEARRKQWDYEAKLSKDYEAKLEREEVERSNAFKARMDTLHAFSSNYEKIAGAKIREQRQQEEERTHSLVAQKNRDDEEKEERKRQQRKNEIMKSTEFNMSLIQHKQQEKDKEREDNHRQRITFEKEFEQQRIRDQQEQQRRKQKQKDIQSALTAQMTTRNVQIKNENALSSIESNLNKDLIAKIERDPELYNKVVQKLQPPQQASRSTGFSLA